MRIAILLVAGLLSMILALGRGPNEENHRAILDALRNIDIAYAAMQRDVLQARSGLLKNYDSLGVAINEMRDELQHINSLSRSFSLRNLTDLRWKLDTVADAIDTNAATMETFKSSNALIQNSLRIFIQALKEMRLREETSGRTPSADMQQLGQEMWQYQISQDTGLALVIHERLTALRAVPSPGAEDLKKSLLDHGFLVLRLLPTVDEIVGRTQATNALGGTHALRGEYLAQFGRINSWVSDIRLVLALISLASCAYAIYLAIHLKISADNLRWRLHVEQTVNDAMTRLSLEPERFPAVMDDALMRMAEVLGFGAVCLASLDPITWSIDSVYGANSISQVRHPLLDDFIADIRTHPSTPADLVMWRRSMPAMGLARLRRSGQGPLAVASMVTLHARRAILLVAECQPANWNSRTDAQILRITTDLLALAIEKHDRLAELDELDRRLEETQRLEAVGTLAGGVAHEFNNILMAIMGYAEMAANNLKSGLQTRLYVEHIITSGRRAKLVIDQMLAFSRLRRNQPQPFDAVHAAREMLPVVEMCVNPAVKLEAALPAAGLAISGSEIELQQVIVNLCKNASEAIAGKGRIKLAIDEIGVGEIYSLSHGHLQPGHYVRISVTDTGPGIAPAQLKRIFEPFFTTKSAQGGTGLGLSVVLGTVQSLHGAMHVASIVGRGTRFELYFPRVDSVVVPMKVPEKIAEIPRGNGELVAIVDADAESLQMWEEKLAALGYEPLGVTSVAEMQELVASGDVPDLVVVVVGDEDEMIRNTAQLFRDLPVLYLCEGKASIEADSTKSRAHHVLKRPINSRRLAGAIADALKRVHATSRVRLSNASSSAC
ncbi:sensor histidine kinase VirA-like protein (plasmid) [Rhizobium etli 8C-3]|uniref:histidine kinase n=1 Tax=Rhizobium etli 8C-3 TaxID=538025 RepID=A0A1L5PAC4_RHIET|nr:DAHL domain-containing protein [Rhizobium etli]APO77147.1 sensor histidine kinase VirA-like protein [Rhizobium etli 8C-3]